MFPRFLVVRFLCVSIQQNVPVTNFVGVGCPRQMAVAKAERTIIMTIKEKNSFYKDFSNRKSYNDIPCKPREVLVPVVLDEEMKKTLEPMGLNKKNAEKWKFPYASEKVTVVFVPVAEEKKDVSMKLFNRQVSDYLGRNTKDEWDELLSTDKFLEDAEDEEGTGFDPTGSSVREDFELLKTMIFDLIEEAKQMNPKYGRVLELLAADYDKGEIVSELKLGKSQGYDIIKKAQAFAKELYNR